MRRRPLLDLSRGLGPSAPPLVRVLVGLVAIVVALSVSGCGLLIALADLGKQKRSSSSGGGDDDEEEEADGFDLGTARFPEGAKKPLAEHGFVASDLDPRDYRFGYVMSKDEQAKALAAHDAFSKKVGYTPMGGGRFRWIIPPGCKPDFGCAFGAMSDESGPALAPIIEKFRAHQKKKQLDAAEISHLVVSFVQDIRYEQPNEQPFGILPPASVVAEKRGDCDSKSLLAHLILRELGVDSVMLSSSAHKHAMLGIAIPAPGKTFRFGGRTYAFTELTAKGSPIGHINPELTRPDDWEIVPTRWPDTGWTGAGAAPPPTDGAPRRR